MWPCWLLSKAPGLRQDVKPQVFKRSKEKSLVKKTCRRLEDVLRSPVRMTFAIGGEGETRTDAAAATGWMMLDPSGRGCGTLGSATLDDDDDTCTTVSSLRFIIVPGHRFGSLTHNKEKVSQKIQLSFNLRRGRKRSKHTASVARATT